MIITGTYPNLRLRRSRKYNWSRRLIEENNLSSNDGIQGLQSLQELRVNNNNIKSLKTLNGLPSLIEIQVVSNQLRSLDGLQNITTLESYNIIIGFYFLHTFISFYD